MMRTVQQVSSTLSLDLDQAEHLLVHCKWNVDILIQRYTDDPDALILAAGLKGRNPQPPPSPTSQCPVCLTPQSGEPDPTPTLCCMHYCCRVSFNALYLILHMLSLLFLIMKEKRLVQRV